MLLHDFKYIPLDRSVSDQSRLAVIIPYRNRASHLEQLVPELQSALVHYNSEIIIVEQWDDHPFNRGALINTAYRELEVEPDYVCFYVCFHDVDQVPVNVDYSRSDHLVFLNPKKSGIGFYSPVVLIPAFDFLKVDGDGDTKTLIFTFVSKKISIFGLESSKSLIMSLLDSREENFPIILSKIKNTSFRTIFHNFNLTDLAPLNMMLRV